MANTVFFPFNRLFIDYIKNTQKNNMKSQHYHDAYEIYLQIEGERYLFLDDICYTLKKGDFVILNPFDIHYMESRDINYYERYVMNFHKESLLCILNESELNAMFSNIDTCVLHLDDEQAASVYSYLKQIDIFSKKTGFLSEKLVYSEVFQLLMMLKDISENARLITSQNTPPEIITAIDYINKNYYRDISLITIADTVHLSKYHFSRLFHNATGATFLEYLYNVRLTKVHKLLLDTKMSLQEVADKTGFSSSAHLSRIFKQAYNVSPREFRRTVKK